MSNRLIVLLVFSTQLGTAAAQGAAAPASRAQRDADNPLRLIIEACKIKPRRAEPEKAARVAERVQARARVAAMPTAAVVPAPAIEVPKAEPEAARVAPESAVREVVVNPPERELAATALRRQGLSTSSARSMPPARIEIIAWARTAGFG